MADVTYADLKAKVIAMRRDPRYRGVAVVVRVDDTVDDTTHLNTLVTHDRRSNLRRGATLMAARYTATVTPPNNGMKGPGRAWTYSKALHDIYWPS